MQQNLNYPTQCLILSLSFPSIIHLHFETNSLLLFQIPFRPASFLGRHLLHPFPLLYFLNLSSLQEKNKNKTKKPTTTY